MQQVEEFVDERHNGWCVHCARWIGEVESNRDHAPSKSLLRKPYPTNLPTVLVCRSCNEGFSSDEEYFVAFLGSVLTGSTDPDRQDNPTVQRILQRSPALRQRIQSARVEPQTLFDQEARVVWAPERERVERVIVKNARGHAYFEYGEPMLEAPAHVWCAPLSLLSGEDRIWFENVQGASLWPEVGSRMMTRVLTGEDLLDRWVIAQEGVYRYAVFEEGRLMVRSVIEEYLATEVLWD